MKTTIKNRDYPSGIRVYYKGQLNEKLLDKLVDIFWSSDEINDKNFRLIKSDKADVFRAEIGDSVYFLKYYHDLSRSKILKNQLRPAEGERHFKTACRLQECGIPVVDPVMGIIRRINFYLTESIYVTREFPGVNLIEFLQQEECAPDFRCEIIKEVAKIWSRLINNKFLHQDPSLLNVLINRREDNYELALVDIENVYSLRFFPQLLFRKNMVKFSARVLSDFIRYELEDLSLKERYLFYRVILDKLDKDIDFKKFWCRITSDTRKRLLHRDSVNVVDADRYLNEKRNRF